MKIEVKSIKKEEENIKTEKESVLASITGEAKIWVNWKYEDMGDGKVTKLPISIDGKTASTSNPQTWSTYEEVIKISDDIGIVFPQDKTLLGIDIDHCLEGNEVVHEEKDKIIKFIKEAETYTEISPSGKGLHIYFMLLDSLELIANKKGCFEAYTSGRYFTVTNNPYNEELPVRRISPDEAIRLLSIIGYPWGKQKKEIILLDNSISSLSDDEVLIKIFNSKNGNKIQSLYEGNLFEYGDDESSADLALCAHLAFWTGCSAEQIERIWLNSPLGKREKTQYRKDYRDRTISKAIGSCKEVYATSKSISSIKTSIQEEKEVLSSEILESKDFKINFLKQQKEMSYEITKYLINKYHVKTIGERIRDIYIYKDGVYVLGINYLKAEIQAILEEYATTNNKNNIIEAIKDSTIAELKDFNIDKNFINLNNGIFNIKNNEFIPHSPEYLFFTKIPVDFDINAKCPVIEKFMDEILPEDYKKIIIEWFGFCLFRNYFIKKAIIFVGEKDTGKSTLIKLFERFIGKDNVSGISLQKIVSDKFASSYLYNKHINVYDDLSASDIKDNGLFKIATGGGVISGEKKFGEQFQFQSFAKLTFACNKIPDVKDTNDDAYFSRWIIVPFLAEITKVDKFLTDKMTTKEELSGLLNWALLGLNKIIRKQDFSYGKPPEEIKKEMLLSGSMVANFAKDCLEEETDAWVSKDAMYEECARYAKLNNLPIVNKQFLGRKLPNHSGYIIDGSKTVETKQVQGWKNVKIKDR